jgi:hypothetical protein
MNSNNILEYQQTKSSSDLEEQIIRLPDEQFYGLVAKRLNIPLSANQMIEREINAAEREYWTEECLVEELFLRIARTKEAIIHNGKRVTIHKYYNQALRLRKWIPIAKPTPEFVIYISDLTPRIMVELGALEKYNYNYVMKQAVGRIFENIDSREYHLSITRKLKVRLDK